MSVSVSVRNGSGMFGGGGGGGGHNWRCSGCDRGAAAEAAAIGEQQRKRTELMSSNGSEHNRGAAAESAAFGDQ